MSEGTSNIEESFISGDNNEETVSTMNETMSADETGTSTDNGTSYESMSGDRTGTSTDNGTSCKVVEFASNVFENPNCAEIGNINTKPKGFISSSLDAESSQSVSTNGRSETAYLTSESPKNSSSSVLSPKQPNPEIIPTLDIAGSLKPGVIKCSGTSKIKKDSAPKKVAFCLPDSDSSNSSTHSSRDIKTAAVSDRYAKGTGLFLEGIASRLLEVSGMYDPKSCETKAKKRSLPKVSVDGRECPESGPSPAKRKDSYILPDTPKVQERTLDDNFTSASMLDTSPRPSVPVQSSADVFNQNFIKMVASCKSEDVNVTKFSENQDISIVSVDVASVASVDLASAASVDLASAASVDVPNLAGPSTSRHLQRERKIDYRRLRRCIDKQNNRIRKQIKELESQGNFWSVFPRVPPCLWQDEDEPVAGSSSSNVSRSFSTLHIETEELVDRVMNLIDGLVETSKEMVEFLNYVKCTNFEDRVRDYLTIYNETVNGVHDLQKEIERLVRDCLNYEPCETRVLSLQESSVGIAQCIHEIMSSITAILGSIEKT